MENQLKLGLANYIHRYNAAEKELTHNIRQYMCEKHGTKQSRQEHPAQNNEKGAGDKNSKAPTEKEALELWDKNEGDLRHSD
jgi:hypothetical protein